MLDGGLNPLYREALAAPHQAYVQVEILDGQQNTLATDLPFTGGAVSATLTSRVARQCDLTLPEDYYAFSPDDLTAPYGNMLRASRGIEFADGSRFAWTVFVGRIQETSLQDDGTCTVRASDFAADVMENRFVRPENATAANTVTEEIQRLIADGFPQAQFAEVEQFDALVGARTWQLDRGQALDELATSVGAFWYPRADGRFVLRRYPWTVANPAVVTYSDVGSLGSVAGVTATRSRAGVFNSLTVTGERLNGDAAVFALAQDTNPDSPTYVGGNFGHRHQLLRLQTPSTQGTAQGAANANLRRTISLNDMWGWSMTVDAALELGDAVQLDVLERTGIVQVVAGYRIPLQVDGEMQVVGRSRIVGILEEVD